ncbi:MAG: hypothetical protein V7709_16320, partial [Halioglobus sp.]
MRTITIFFLPLLFALAAALPSSASTSTAESPTAQAPSTQKIYASMGILDIDGIDSALQSFT